MNSEVAKLQGFGPYNNQERMAPAFKLPAAQGGTIALWDYKQRKQLVLYFLPHPDSGFLSRLQTENPAYQETGAQLLVIVPAPLEQLTALHNQLALNYPLLTDEEGRAYKRYLHLIEADIQQELPAAVFVADRFGAITRYATAPRPAMLPSQTEILGMLEFLGTLCNP